MSYQFVKKANVENLTELIPVFISEIVPEIDSDSNESASISSVSL